MEIIVKGYIAPKLKEKYSDCADSYANSFDNRKFAISDGVTKSFFPSVWSKLLVEKFVQEKEIITKDNIIDKFIRDCQEEWYKKVTVEVEKPNTPWFTKKSYMERKFAMATFIGLQFYEKEGHWKWNAIGLGDSYLIFVPANAEKDSKQWIEVATMENLKEPTFDNYPNYYASIGNQHKGEPYFIEDNNLVEGTFYLMTDALAEWFFNEKEAAIEKIQMWKNQEGYINFIEKERADNLLKDDDSAIMIITIPKQIHTLIVVDRNISILQELIDKEGVDEIEKKKSEKTENTKEGDVSSKETKESEVVPTKEGNVSSKETKEGEVETIKEGDVSNKETKEGEFEPIKEEDVNNKETKEGEFEPIKEEGVSNKETKEGEFEPIKEEDVSNKETKEGEVETTKKGDVSNKETKEGEVEPIKQGDVSNKETKEGKVEPKKEGDVSNKETKENPPKTEVKKTPFIPSTHGKSTEPEFKKSNSVKEKVQNQQRNAINQEEITNKF